MWGREGGSFSSLSYVATRHFISTTSSQHCHLYTEFAVYRCLSFFSLVFLHYFFSLFLPDLLQPSLVATTHYMRTIDVRSLEISPFVSVEMQRRSFSLFLVLCSLGTVIVGDIIFTVAILVIYERFVVMHSMWKTKVGARKFLSSFLKFLQIFIYSFANTCILKTYVSIVFIWNIVKTQILFRLLFYIKYIIFCLKYLNFYYITLIQLIRLIYKLYTLYYLFYNRDLCHTSLLYDVYVHVSNIFKNIFWQIAISNSIIFLIN